MQWIKKSSQQLNLKPKNPLKNAATFILYMIKYDNDTEVVKTKFMGEYKEPYDALLVNIIYNMGEQKNLGIANLQFNYNNMQPDTLYKIEMLDGQIQAFINRSNGLLEHYVFEQ